MSQSKHTPDVLSELREAAARKWQGDPEAQRAGLFARAAAEVERLRADLAAMTADRDSWADQAEQRVADWDAERRKVEALRSASVGSRGWLVEWRYHGSVQWLYLWSAACGGFLVTPDASEALRLARREDAEAVLEWARDTDSRRGLHSGTFLVTEHVWESAALASTEGGA